MHMNTFTTTSQLAVAPGFILTCHMCILCCHKYHSSNWIHRLLSPSLLSLSKYMKFHSFRLLSSNTLSCVLLSHIYPPLLQFPRSESVTLFCFSSGVSVSFECNSHRTLPTLFHAIYIHMQPRMHSQTYTRTHTHRYTQAQPSPTRTACRTRTHTHTHSMFQREWCLTGTSDSSLITSSL